MGTGAHELIITRADLEEDRDRGKSLGLRFDAALGCEHVRSRSSRQEENDKSAANAGTSLDKSAG